MFCDHYDVSSTKFDAHLGGLGEVAFHCFRVGVEPLYFVDLMPGLDPCVGGFAEVGKLALAACAAAAVACEESAGTGLAIVARPLVVARTVAAIFAVGAIVRGIPRWVFF